MPALNSALSLRSLLTVFLLVAASARAQSDDEASPSFAEEIRPFFAPIPTDRATLSPDGRHVAYTQRIDKTTYVMIMDVDHPEKKVPVAVAIDQSSQSFSKGEFADRKIPGKVRFLDWSSANRLVMGSDLPEIFAIDADGSNPTKLVELKESALWGELGHRAPVVIGLMPNERNQLIVLARGPTRQMPPRQSIDTYKVDVTTGKIVHLMATLGPLGSLVLPDRQGRQRIVTNPHEREQNYDVAYPESAWKVRGQMHKLFGDDQAACWRVSPENYLGERAFPLGFDQDPNLLYFASNIRRDTYGIYALDLRTGQTTGLSVEDSRHDLASPARALTSAQLVFDRRTGQLTGVRHAGARPGTKWLDPEITSVQSEVDAIYPSRFVKLIDWNDTRSRFLVQVSSPSDPGRYYIYRRTEKRLMEFLRLAPDLEMDALNLSTPFAFDTPAGVHLTGTITQPTNPRIEPPPILIYCADGANGNPPTSAAYQARVQALASMGLVVVQVNYRGTGGLGRAHLDAGLKAFDRAPVEDILAVIDWVSSQQPVNRKRVALFGTGFGGYVALRALQLEPERFRCAITIDAPTDLNNWINHQRFKLESAMPTGGGPDKPASGLSRMGPIGRQPFDFYGAVRRQILGQDRQRLLALSPGRHPELIQRPVLLIQSTANQEIAPSDASNLRDALVRQGLAAEYISVDRDFDRQLPGASVSVFAQIEEFINLTVYDYGVHLGPTEFHP